MRATLWIDYAYTWAKDKVMEYQFWVGLACGAVGYGLIRHYF